VANDRDSVADPALRLIVSRSAAPSLNVTVPSGVPPVDVTVAMKVTNWLTGTGFGDADSAVLVALRFTTWVRTAD
jgi:hypothetical protein